MQLRPREGLKRVYFTREDFIQGTNKLTHESTPWLCLCGFMWVWTDVSTNLRLRYVYKDKSLILTFFEKPWTINLLNMLWGETRRREEKVSDTWTTKTFSSVNDNLIINSSVYSYGKMFLPWSNAVLNFPTTQCVILNHRASPLNMKHSVPVSSLTDFPI